MLSDFGRWYDSDSGISKIPANEEERMKKQVLMVLMIAVVCTGILLGTGQKESSGATATGPQAREVITWLHFANDVQQPALDAVVAAFEATYDIDVEIEFRPGSAEGENLVKTRIAANDLPDVLSYNSGSLFQVLNLTKNFVDLSNEPLADKLLDSFKATVSAGTGLYGVPYQPIPAGGIIYNKQVYKDLGLEIPLTWTAFIDNCEIIKQAGIVPVIASYKDDWTAQLLLLADYFNVEASEPDFAANYTANKAKYASTPAALRGFEKIQEVFTKELINKEPMATTYDMAQEMLATGQGAHYPMATWVLSGINEKFPEAIDDMGFFALPGDDASKNGATLWMPNNISIPKSTTHLAAALKFANFMVSDEGLAAFMSAGAPDGTFAVRGVDLPDAVFPAVKDVLRYVDANKTAAALEFLSPIKGPNLPQICVQSGLALKTPLECAAEYDRDVEKQAKQLMLAGW
jgi:raffinose/stachyose/melibiose transport system substrate-binding protein